MCGNDNLHFFSFNHKKWILVPLYQMNSKCLLLFYVNDIADDISIKTFQNMVIIIYGKNQG